MPRFKKGDGVTATGVVTASNNSYVSVAFSNDDGIPVWMRSSALSPAADPAPVAETEWTTVEELPPGQLFETKGGIRAVKSEYRLSSGRMECVLLASGEYAHFPDGNETVVKRLVASDLSPDPAPVAPWAEAVERVMREMGS